MVRGQFDVIAFNPPYSDYASDDVTDRMFWDPQHKTKIRFFEEVTQYLKPRGRVYFGWANFKDLDVNLPLRLAEANGFVITKVAREESDEGFTFLVFEMKRQNE